MPGSSADGIASVSIMKMVKPAGDWPLIVNGLNLSKLLRRSGFARYSVPPFFACGSANSKWSKPAGYLGWLYGA